MERSNRTIWIVVAVVVVLVLLCGCLALGGGAIVAALTAIPFSGVAPFNQVEETSEQVFNVEAAPLIEVDNFAGDITVRTGQSGQVRIVVTRRAGSGETLSRIDADVSETGEGVEIRTSRSGAQTGSMSVRIEVYAPPDARLALDTGAGNVTALGIEGTIMANSGAGDITVRDAAGAVELSTGAGDIDYSGEPEDTCNLNTGAGDITLTMPAAVDAEIALNTGIGDIDLGGFEIEGDTEGTDVEGVLGTGDGASISANTALGNIRLVQR